MKALLYIGIFVALFLPKIAFTQENIEFTTDDNNTSSNYVVILAWGSDEHREQKISLNITPEFLQSNPHPVGLWYSTALKKWAIYNEDRAPFPKNIRVNNVVQLYGFNNETLIPGLVYFKAIVSAANLSNNEVVIDNEAINGMPFLDLRATHIYSDGADAEGIYNEDYPLLKYNSISRRWILYNKNNTPLKPGMVFSIAGKSSGKLEQIAKNNNLGKGGIVYKAQKLKFRVSINGFSCITPTADHILEVDGKGDEVFFGSLVQWFNAATGEKISKPKIKWTVRYGDINSEEGRVGLRIKAGSKPGAMGGVQGGDQFPAIEAWKRKQPLNNTSLPVLILEGTFNSPNDAVMVVPSIWEFDGTTEEEQALNNFASTFTQAGIFLGTGIVATIVVGPEVLPLLGVAQMQTLMDSRKPLNGEPVANLPIFAELDLKNPVFNIQVKKTLFGDAKDRPIGMKDVGDCFKYVPIGMLLRPQNIVELSNSDFGFGKGILPMRFKDVPAMQGEYIVYLQIEYKKENEPFNNVDRVYADPENPSNTYRFQNASSGACLIESGSVAVSNTQPGNSDWTLVSANPRIPDIYYIVNKNGKYLGLPSYADNDTRNGSPVYCNELQQKDTYRWKIVSNADGSYSVINVFAKKALAHEITSGRIIISENRANPEQRWIITER